MPIIKKILRKQLFSGIIYFFVEKLVSMGTRKISAEEDKKQGSGAADSSAPLPAADKGFLRINKKAYDKISQASNVIFTTLSILGMIASGLCIITGIAFLVILIILA